MENWAKRAAFLSVFGLVLGVALFFSLKTRLAGRVEDTHPKPKPPKTAAEKKTNQDESLPPAPIAPLIPAPPAKAAMPLPGAEEEPLGVTALRDLIMPEDEDSLGDIDRAGVEKAIRDYIPRYNPNLKLSNSDYERLADAIVRFREAKLRTQTTDRTGAEAAVFRQAIREMEGAMRDFREITNMSPQNFFTGEEPPVLFGDEFPSANDDESSDEFLSDFNP